jgi:GTP pyrophosphokinase
MEVIDVELERKEILKRYRKLLRSAKPILKDGDARLIKRAFFTSMEAHKGMRRKSGEPYIYHPLAVAQIAIDEIGLGTTSVVAALLHDVVEDTDLEVGDIERDFGPKVAKIIDGLTKISGVFEYGTSQQAENFRKMLLTLSDDVRVILIKLADRLHNMRTLGSMARNSQLKIASETIYIYAPLAHRLGLYAIKTELEDLHLKHTEPEVYRQIADSLRQTKASRDKFIKDFITPLETELAGHGFDFVIKGRPKSIYSIWNKMKKQKIPFDEVYDLFAIRVILRTKLENEKAACWQVYSIVTDFYKPNPDRLRDWISTPRSNGYESLHTTVMSKTGQWVEVQIRTERMDEIAEKGYAAHWKYKEAGQSNQSGLEVWIRKVRKCWSRTTVRPLSSWTTSAPTSSTRSVRVHAQGRLENPAPRLHGPRLCLRHPLRDRGALPGAKVNQKLVPLNYILHNGDQVEILTSNKQKPNEDWLKFVVTSKARTKIKEFMREDKRRVISRAARWCGGGSGSSSWKMSPKSSTSSGLLQRQDDQRLLLPGRQGLHFLERDQEVPERKVAEGHCQKGGFHRRQELRKEIKKIRGVESDMLLIGEDMDKIDYILAKCCNPIPGDDVFGFVTVNEGIKIHRTSCPNAVELMSNYGYRIIKAKWTSQTELAFLAGLRITGTDRVGLVNDVTRIISNELKVNMRSITIDTNDGIFEGNIMLFVHDTTHLETLMRKLYKVDGIVNVTRFDS